MQTYAISLKSPGLTEAKPTIGVLYGIYSGTMHKSYSCVGSSSCGPPNLGTRLSLLVSDFLYWVTFKASAWEEVLCFITIWYSMFDCYQWEVFHLMNRRGRLRKGLWRENGGKTTVIMRMINNYNNNYIYYNNIILQLLYFLKSFWR